MRLLIAEDSPPMVELLTGFLKPICSFIESCGTLEDALRIIGETPFNICILDLRLLDSDVDNTINHIPDFKKHDMAVVAISGRPDPNLRRRVMASGADVFVPKDGNFGEMAMRIAIEIAVLKMPAKSLKSESYYAHTQMLKQLVGHQ